MAEHVTDLLSAYLDHELDDFEQKRVEYHLSFCSECRREFAELASLKQQIDKVYESVQVPEGLEQAVMKNIGQRQFAHGIGKWMAVAVAALLAVVVFMSMSSIVGFGTAIVSAIVNVGFSLLHMVPFIVSSIPSLFVIVLVTAVVLIVASLWSLHRLLETRTVS